MDIIMYRILQTVKYKYMFHEVSSLYKVTDAVKYEKVERN